MLAGFATPRFASPATIERFVMAIEQSPAEVRDYVDADGVHTYYEARGAGTPVVLLHGGLSTAEAWGGQAPALAEHHRVYVPERRGHGRTADSPAPFTYPTMADETIAFLDALAIGPAHLVGWSDGALVGLLVALRRPDLVRKLVLVGQYVNLDGAVPENTALMNAMTRATFPPRFEQAYAALSPDGPDHFGVVFEKSIALWRSDPGIPVDDLAGVAAPTLVLLADDDVLTIEHAAAMQRALSNSQLAIVPGTSHALPMEKPDLVNRIILEFLADQQVPKLLVLRDMLATLAADDAR
jgi:pimeloyl-ACP methyl ester carboxylesterase